VAGAVWWGYRHLTSPAVIGWRPPTGHRHRAGQAGPLAVRVIPADPVGDERPEVALLLHGMTGTGDVFGAGFDVLAAGATVVAPDLLGFGGSRHVAGETGLRPGAGEVAIRLTPDLDAQMDALDDCLAALGLAEPRVVVAGHGLGGIVALHWAARRAARRPGSVGCVVTFGAPLYRDPAEAEDRLRLAGTRQSVLPGGAPVASGLRNWMGRHQAVGSYAGVLLRPDLPLAVARAGAVRPEVAAGLEEVGRSGSWARAIATLSTAGVRVVLAEGGADPVPVPSRSAELAQRHRRVRAVVHPAAGHELPLSDPDWCLATIRSARITSAVAR
jgi:pimeloyl-ACP methyl ester carboxylesterase